MNQPQTPDNEVASDYVADTPITSDLLEELKRPSEGDRKDLITLCREFERELAEKTNEVARLRGLLKDHATFMRENGFTLQADILEHGANCFTAPAPEEPVNPTCANTTHKFSHCDCHRRERMVCDKCQKTDEPAPEYRDLGPDEVIQEGDEAMSPELPFLLWEKVRGSIGDRAGDWSDLKFRTRRPLPVQDEMPLEKELDYLTREASRASDIHNHVLIVDCIRYLRDEIVKIGNISSEDSGYNFAEIEKIWKEIQKLKEK